MVLIGDRQLITERAVQQGINVDGIQEFDAPASPVDGATRLLHVPTASPARAGTLDAKNASYVLATLDAAIDGCKEGRFHAMTTAPIHKGIINDAGHTFSGHTEYLAESTATEKVVMMLAADRLRVALATTHLPLRDVPDHITEESLKATLQVLIKDLQSRFGIARPRILVCGLNPHAGEGGHLGHEDDAVIAPALRDMKDANAQLVGPLPADTAFTPRALDGADAVLAMYHDQGLPVLKFAGFGSAINITLGLPIIRTSVDHGTALDIAGTGIADTGSLFAALDLAIQLAQRR